MKRKGTLIERTILCWLLVLLLNHVEWQGGRIVTAVAASVAESDEKTILGSDSAAAAEPEEDGDEEADEEQEEDDEESAVAQKDQVGHTAEAAALRHYQLRKKKRKGLFRRKEASLADVLFPGVAPELYQAHEKVFMMTDLVQSKKTPVPFEYYDLPVCETPALADFRQRHWTQRKNLGARLLGTELKPAPFVLEVLQEQSCTKVCSRGLTARQVRWLRKLVERQYRVHTTFDSLPVLMRSSQLNYAVRGFPVGFKAPPSYTGLEHDEYFLYNHFKFTITYEVVRSTNTVSTSTATNRVLRTRGTTSSTVADGIYITGFDVHPVSIVHDATTCRSPHENPTNEPATYLRLVTGSAGQPLNVTYSYQVEWLESELPWADRWDVYLIGSPDDDIHFFAIFNSLMIVLFLTGAIATIMIRTLKRDISNYNEMAVLADAGTTVVDETGWKLVHGDVFRPPPYGMILAVLVGNGAQIGTAFFISMVAAVCKLLNPVKKGHTLTALVVLYVLSGSIAGYVSARVAQVCHVKNWKLSMILTATALPGILVGIFTILNVFLSGAGAATAVSIWMLLSLFALWVCVSAPLVLVGYVVGWYGRPALMVPTVIAPAPRPLPPLTDLPWYVVPPLSWLAGGILPFGSVCIELFFIMSALWLHQIYYVMGFLLAVWAILAATCAQVSIVLTYLQLCHEDYRWWWSSFMQAASAGLYLWVYSLWFLVSRLELVGVLPVVVYLTYMSMMSLLFAIFCGAVGFLCAFAFVWTIYGALKVD